MSRSLKIFIYIVLLMSAFAIGKDIGNEEYTKLEEEYDNLQQSYEDYKFITQGYNNLTQDQKNALNEGNYLITGEYIVGENNSIPQGTYDIILNSDEPVKVTINDEEYLMCRQSNNPDYTCETELEELNDVELKNGDTVDIEGPKIKVVLNKE